MTFDVLSFDENYRCEVSFETKTRQIAKIDIKIPPEIETNDEIEVSSLIYHLFLFLA